MVGLESIPSLINNIPTEVITFPWYLGGVLLFYFCLILLGSIIFCPDIINSILQEKKSIKVKVIYIILIGGGIALTLKNLNVSFFENPSSIFYLLLSATLIELITEIIGSIDHEAGKTFFETVSSIVLILIFFTPTRGVLDLKPYEQISILISLYLIILFLGMKKTIELSKSLVKRIIIFLIGDTDGLESHKLFNFPSKKGVSAISNIFLWLVIAFVLYLIYLKSRGG